MIYDYVRALDASTPDDPDPTPATPSNLSIPAVWPQTSTRPSVLYFSLVGEDGAGTRRVNLSIWSLIETAADVLDPDRHASPNDWRRIERKNVNVGDLPDSILIGPGRFYVQVRNVSAALPDDARLLLFSSSVGFRNRTKP